MKKQIEKTETTPFKLVQVDANLCKRVFFSSLHGMDSADYSTCMAFCLGRIEQKLGWGSALQWQNQTFEALSEKIHGETGILLSDTTLKRVWGRLSYNSMPSTVTLQALAQFAGFENWEMLRTTCAERSVDQKSTTKRGLKLIVVQNSGVILGAAAMLTVLVLSLFSMMGAGETTANPKVFTSSHFNSAPITKGLPNSVVFNVDLQGVESDCLYIQQFWDPTKTVALKPGQSKATGIYYWPGYFRSKLIIDGTIVTEHDLFIPSEGWMATLDYAPVPSYIFEPNSTPLALPELSIQELIAQKEPLTSTFHYVAPFNGVQVDNLTLTTELQVEYSNQWAVCQNIRIVLLGKKGAMIIPFSIAGCVSDLNVLLNDVYLNGKQEDLSAFAADFRTPKTIKIAIFDKSVQVQIDQELRFTGAYTEAIGELVGMRFRFIGAGSVGFVQLENHADSTVLNPLLPAGM